MRSVLYVADAASIHARRWAEHFRDRGLEVHVASLRPAKIEGVEVHLLDTRRLGRAGYLLAIVELRALAGRLKPDVVHAHYVTSYGFIAAAAGLHPLVVTAWGTDVLISPRRSRLLRACARFAVRSADVVTTVAEHMNAAVAELGIPLRSVRALPFGVDVEVFRPPLAERPPAPPLRVISTRNLAPVYSVHTVVEAARLATESGLDLHLDLVGDGPLRAGLEAQVNAAGIGERVAFHGHVDRARLAGLLQHAHVFVTSAISDGNNVSLNEAMACGCFPIGTDIPANSQWIAHARNGYLFECGDAAALAERLSDAAGAPDLRVAAALENRKLVETRADWRICVREMQSIYERAALARAGR